MLRVVNMVVYYVGFEVSFLGSLVDVWENIGVFKYLPFLLLDDATNALDAKSEGMVHTALDQAALGCMMCIVAHCLSTIRYARLTTVFHNGQVARSESMRKFCGVWGLCYSHSSYYHK
ncbi:hypothetical protein GOP47_0004782 [Adiantum capillus-veneris]|uniref:Uncharacterized protein n=1 Tax=Adiantum capillus-veneris TaxID=13818 RepID=A0A9D4V441_ADICA|nr:hypothetical protein GOP47_0004782 [Adiantum capillus-veneris]